MIKAEILKDGRTYEISFPEAENLKQAFDIAIGVAKGREVFEGDQLLDLGSSAEYQHIMVYFAEDPAVVSAPEPDSAAPEPDDQSYIRPFYDKVTFLGNTVEVRAVKAAVSGVHFILVYDVNEMPALMSMSKTGLQNLAYHIGQVQGANDPTVIIQAADLADEEEAISYVEDYLADLVAAADSLPKADLTAVAFPGINEGESGVYKS